MNKSSSFIRIAAACAVATALVAQPVLAQPDHAKGKGKGKGNQSSNGGGHQGGSKFESRQQVVVRDYYVQEYQRGHCPPGLAKKNNGCMPPGQAKKWRMGQPLPREVVYYELPPALVVQIGVPPPGHKYVRVASDILMIAVGTAMVVDAIHDLGRM